MNATAEAVRIDRNGYEKILFPIVDFCAIIAGISLTIMMLLTAFDVIARVFSTSIIGAYELVEFLMGITVPLALCYCEKKREHISVDLIMQRFSASVRRFVDLVTSILVLVLFFAIAWQCWINVGAVHEDQLTSSVLLLSVWPYTIPSAIAFSLLFLLCINHIVKVIKTIAKGEGEVV